MKLLKKIFALMLICTMMSISTLPTLAEELYPAAKNVTMHSNEVLTLHFMNDFNANDADEGDTVAFKLYENFTDAEGDYIPANTIFYGTIDKAVKSKFGFRKARAYIDINRMELPDGRVYAITAEPSKGNLSAPGVANFAKGAALSTAAAGVCVFGAMVIAVECLSIGGIILAPYTGAAVGVAIAATSKGVNYRVSAGTPVSIKFDSNVNITY